MCVRECMCERGIVWSAIMIVAVGVEVGMGVVGLSAWRGRGCMWCGLGVGGAVSG